MTGAGALAMSPALRAAAGDMGGFEPLLLVLASTIVATKLFGALAQRLGQPAVLGELLAGVVLGTSVLGLFNTHNPVLHAFAEIGVLVLLFQIGLHTDLRSLAKVGATAITVGGVGVVVPEQVVGSQYQVLMVGVVASLPLVPTAFR